MILSFLIIFSWFSLCMCFALTTWNMSSSISALIVNGREKWFDSLDSKADFFTKFRPKAGFQVFLSVLGPIDFFGYELAWRSSIFGDQSLYKRLVVFLVHDLSEHSVELRVGIASGHAST